MKFLNVYLVDYCIKRNAGFKDNDYNTNIFETITMLQILLNRIY